MFVLSHRNIRLPSPDGKSSFFIARGYVGEIPDCRTPPGVRG